MPVRCSFFISYIVALIAASQNALGADFATAASLQRTVYEAAIVARIHVLGREPVWVMGSGNSRACGYLYKAAIVESFKGGSDTFEFFSPAARDFVDFGRDYFIIINERVTTKERDAIMVLRDQMSREEMWKLMCVTSSQYYAASNYQTMRAFDLEAAKEFGSEWLIPTNRADLRWCTLDGVKDFAIQGDWYSKEKTKGVSSTRIVNWDSARKLILRAVKSGSPAGQMC